MIYNKILLHHAFEDIEEIKICYEAMKSTLVNKFNENLTAEIKTISKNSLPLQI
jgi:hypothetical protein